jgi:hypothetical protein
MSETVYPEIVRELSWPRGVACLVKRGEEFFVISSITSSNGERETLTFPARADGTVTSHNEVLPASGRGTFSRTDAIRALAVTPAAAPALRVIVATGIPGYGPDAANENYAVCGAWPDVADAIRDELQICADMEHDSAESYADSGDYKAAWETHKRVEDMANLAANFDNARQDAPLYEGQPALWDETIERMVSEHFPYDVNSSLRLYVWESAEFGADEEEED